MKATDASYGSRTFSGPHADGEIKAVVVPARSLQEAEERVSRLVAIGAHVVAMTADGSWVSAADRG